MISEKAIYTFIETGCAIANSIDPSGKVCDNLLAAIEDTLLTELARRYVMNREIRGGSEL